MSTLHLAVGHAAAKKAWKEKGGAYRFWINWMIERAKAFRVCFAMAE